MHTIELDLISFKNLINMYLFIFQSYFQHYEFARCMTWYEKVHMINNGLNEAVNLLHKYVNHQKFFLDPEHLECWLVCNFFTESRLAAWRFLKLTVRVEPSFYKWIIDKSADCNIHATVYMALCLKSSILEVWKILNNDSSTDLFNDRNISVLFNLLFTFLPEMKSLIRVYCSVSCFDRLEEKASELKRKWAVTLDIIEKRSRKE